MAERVQVPPEAEFLQHTLQDEKQASLGKRLVATGVTSGRWRGQNPAMTAWKGFEQSPDAWRHRNRPHVPRLGFPIVLGAYVNHVAVEIHVLPGQVAEFGDTKACVSQYRVSPPLGF